MVEARYVLLKRDLFECPKHQGYTGIRDNAGTWTLDELKGLDLPIRAEYERWQQEHYALPLEAAPEFTNSCFPDLARDHLIQQRDALRAALARAEANAGEPVAWGEDIDGKIVSVRLDKSRHCTVPLYRAPQPSGTVEVKPLAGLIHDALAFAVWAAGEGLCPTDGPPAPEDFLYAYSTATGFEDWDAIPHHVATTLAALTAGKPEQVPSGPVEALADALRGLLKAYENAFDWTAELPPETAEAERIANEVLEALTSSKPEQSGWKLVPKEPSRGRLISMAIRHNHAFLINPDPSATWWSSGVKPEHRESILRNMKQLYEEAIGEGFYSPDKEAGYVTSFEKAQGSASPTPPTAGGE